MSGWAAGQETRDADMLTRRLRRLLRDRHAMHIGELCLRLGLRDEVVRGRLGEMMAAEEVERLRPIGCEHGEHDFFRLREPGSVQVVFTGSRTNEETVAVARAAMACV